MKPSGILLIDSGGQYLDGTTDTTRTLTLGPPTNRQRRVFTTVLKSLIALTTTVFPRGTTGSHLDTLARASLWHQGWECRHGIGHGVGYFLNVHEGPQRFSKDNEVTFEPGMVTTSEPGVYFEGEFGVRLENVLLTIEHNSTEFGEFYAFETLTLCPIDLDLVEPSLMTASERVWLNGYRELVYQSIAPHLSTEQQQWLKEKTRGI